MKTATVSQTKNSLSALLARVRHGETIVITDRSRPVARLEPIAASESVGHDEARLLRLERAGVLRRGRGGPLFRDLEDRSSAARTGRRHPRSHAGREAQRPVRFWDTSALVPLLVPSASTGRMRALYRSDTAVAAWWATRVECESAISRLSREAKLQRRSVSAARGRLDRFAATWHEVLPLDPLRESARRLLRTHDLRAGDALQLAAALAACNGRPAMLAFVCLDDRLAAAAEARRLCGHGVAPRSRVVTGRAVHFGRTGPSSPPSRFAAPSRAELSAFSEHSSERQWPRSNWIVATNVDPSGAQAGPTPRR